MPATIDSSCRGGPIGPPGLRAFSLPPRLRAFQPPTPSLQHPNPNRDTNLLETELNQRKQKPAPGSNRDKIRLFFTSFRRPHPPTFQTQSPQNSWGRAKNDASPIRFLFRLKPHPALYFVRLREILNEPLFRLTMRTTANRNRKPSWD